MPDEDLTPDIVTEARRLLDAATPGPWGLDDERLHVIKDYPAPFICRVLDEPSDANAAFIAAAPRLVTELVAEVERLREALDQRTDPELAARLRERADGWKANPDDLLAAARLLGGDQ